VETMKKLQGKGLVRDVSRSDSRKRKGGSLFLSRGIWGLNLFESGYPSETEEPAIEAGMKRYSQGRQREEGGSFYRDRLNISLHLE